MSWIIPAGLMVILALIAVVHHIAVNEGVIYPGPLSLFFAYQILNAVGTILLGEFGVYESDRIRVASVLIGLAGITAGAIVANYSRGFRPRREVRAFQERRPAMDVTGLPLSTVIVPVAVVSLLVGFVYVSLMGYSMPLELFKAYRQYGNIGDSAAIYGELRTSVWRDPSRYIAPGYSAQFMKILLPVAGFVWYFRALHLRRWADWFVSIVLFFCSIYLLASTGVRAYLILFGITFVALTSRRFGPLAKSLRLRSRLVPILIAVVFGLVGLFTFLGGRSGSSESVGGNVAGVVMNIVNRTVFVMSDVQLIIMRTLVDYPKGWGRGVIDNLTILLPGSREMRSNEIYAFVYGGYGNAPLDLWSNIWLEFGWLGVALVPPLVGFALQRFFIRSVRGRKSILRSVIFFTAAFTLIEIPEPIAVLNNGFLTLMILWGFILLSRAVGEQKLARPSYRPATVGTSCETES